MKTISPEEYREREEREALACYLKSKHPLNMHELIIENYRLSKALAELSWRVRWNTIDETRVIGLPGSAIPQSGQMGESCSTNPKETA
jgi:hypothetical protein